VRSVDAALWMVGSHSVDAVLGEELPACPPALGGGKGRSAGVGRSVTGARRAEPWRWCGRRLGPELGERKGTGGGGLPSAWGKTETRGR
jgi:hypothetical protein